MTARHHSHDGDDFDTHVQLARDRYVAGLEAMIDEGNTTLGWLQAWPNQITNAEPELVSVLTALRLALSRVPVHDEVSDPRYERLSLARKTYTQDASGDLDLVDP